MQIMMRVFTALLLTSADAAVVRRSGEHPLLLAREVQSQEVLANGQVMSASSVFSELWSELIIEQSNKTAKTNKTTKPIDLAKSDKEVKDKFVTDCVVVLDVHNGSISSVDKVVKSMCSKAGGTAIECRDMTKELWKAHKDKKLKPWCEKQFSWFASKTKPRCLKSCKALLCKDRCKQQDQLSDVSDQIAAYKIKMGTVATQQKRLDKEYTNVLKIFKAKIEAEDKAKCTPATANVTKLEGSQKSTGKELGDLVKAAAKAGDVKDKAFAELKKLRADKKAKKADISKAAAAFKKANDDFKDAKSKQAAKNKSLQKLEGEVKKAKTKQSFQCKALKEMKAEYDKAKKNHGVALKDLAAAKKKIKDPMDKAIAAKKKMETDLKAALKAM